jgi:hypothetical protein
MTGGSVRSLVFVGQDAVWRERESRVSQVCDALLHTPDSRGSPVMRSTDELPGCVRDRDRAGDAEDLLVRDDDRAEADQGGEERAHVAAAHVDHAEGLAQDRRRGRPSTRV